MHILQISHPVPSYDAWKSTFDNDPISRTQMAVRRYRIMRPVNDEHSVTIELEFDSAQAADACLAALRQLWVNVQGTIMLDPTAAILEVVEDQSL